LLEVDGEVLFSPAGDCAVRVAGKCHCIRVQTEQVWIRC
jgi:hypothetical protein